MLWATLHALESQRNRGRDFFSSQGLARVIGPYFAVSTPESFNEAINVLHVDDHPAIVQAGRDYLRERFPVAEYVGLDCYREAQERLEQQQFSVIILDLLVGGSILLERIRPFAECAPTIIWSMRF